MKPHLPIALLALFVVLFASPQLASSQPRVRDHRIRCQLPTLYGEPYGKGDALRIRAQRGYEYPSLALSDEEGFDDRAASVCVPTGYVLELYEHIQYQGEKLVLHGARTIPDLGRMGWGGRASSAKSWREEESAPQPRPPSPGGSANGDWRALTRAYDSVVRHGDCKAVSRTLTGLQAELGNGDPIPNEVALRYGLRRATIAALARHLIVELRSHRPECRSGGTEARAAWEVIEESYRQVSGTNDCRIAVASLRRVSAYLDSDESVPVRIVAREGMNTNRASEFAKHVVKFIEVRRRDCFER
jgi:hypothetical protein